MQTFFPPKHLIFFENIFQFSKPFLENVLTTEGINLSFFFSQKRGFPPQKREFLFLRKYCLFFSAFLLALIFGT